MPERPRVHESPEVLERYHTLKDLGKKIFAGSEVAETGIVAPEDLLRADAFLSEGARLTDPPVRALWWEHTAIASEFALRMSGDPTLKFAMNFHDIGRWVTPNELLRNDQIADRLFAEWGIDQAMETNLFSLPHLMSAGRRFISSHGADNELALTDDQQRGGPLHEAQAEFIHDFVQKLPRNHAITFVADTLGKRTTDRKLFDIPELYKYMATESERYGLDPTQVSPWASVARVQHDNAAFGTLGPKIGLTMVEEMIQRLMDEGIDVEGVHKTLENYGPKFMIVARHGNVDNPHDMAYNRDEFMKPEDIMDIDESGEEQMRQDAEVIKKRMVPGIKVAVTSPAHRARRSIDILTQELGIANAVVDERLNEMRAPGGYLEGMTLTQISERLAQPDGEEWRAYMEAKYEPEKPAEVSNRMHEVFWDTVDQLNVGESGIILSHGEPLKYLKGGSLLGQYYQGEYQQEMPPKGSAQLVVVGPNDRITATYFLRK